MREPLPDCTLTAGEMLLAVAREEMPFALVGRWAGVRAVVGFGPSEVVRGEFPPDVAADAPSGLAIGGGWFGWLGFAMGRRVERLPFAPPRPAPLSDAVFGWYSSVLVLDADGRWWFESLTEDGAALDRVRSLLAVDVASQPWSLTPMALHGGGASAHRAAVAECVERIAAGELFQANLCVRLDGVFSGDAASAFAAAVSSLDPAYGAFFAFDDAAVLSFSPELFLRRVGRSVETAPIKGTAPRSTPRSDLAASAKDAAEHVMIVDLMRNDLGRVAAYGSVSADEAPVVEAHPGVWHLVSRVRAELREGVGDDELLRATFPPGSVTGAPKVQALKVITALEGTAREVYTGAIGYVSPVAGLELNVAIRTLEVRGERAWLGCGGGIVADSDPEAELREALGKAAPILSALGSSVPPIEPAPVPRPLSFPHLERPDPGAGVFTTLAVRDGLPIDLDRHLERLAASARVLYGVELPGDLALPDGDHRVRIAVSADGSTSVSSAPLTPGPPAAALLDPVVLAGGLGEHKWLDRTPLDPFPGALILDLDGAVLEAAWANVWAIEGDTLVTPPADGRILPGVVRDGLLSQDGFTEAPLDLDRLRAADGIVLTSSIRVATPAALRGATPTPAAREVAAAIREAQTSESVIRPTRREPSRRCSTTVSP